MDEAEIAKQKYISVLVGSLDAPNQTFLIDCHPLDSGSNVNTSIILPTVDDILRQLEIKRDNLKQNLLVLPRQRKACRMAQVSAEEKGNS